MKGQSFAKRLRFAARGLYFALLRERSFRVHVLATFGVAVVLLATRASPAWWAIGALTVGVVLTAELFNTALEVLADHLHPAQHPEIRALKDIAAGAVLISSVMAIAVAIAFLLR